MSENPNPWIDALLAKLELFVELQSSGALDIQYVEGELVISPDVLELVGGENDGDEVFPFFNVELSALMDEFDERPEVTWNTMHDELWVDGQIGGTAAFVIFRRNPFSDVGSASRVLDGSTIREKREP
jgi:hypothetical protein